MRVHLAHAALQVVGEETHSRVLHIKGPAVDPGLGRSRSRSTDADVLVRPSQIEAYVRGLVEHGWTAVTSFESGSAFEHAATYFHPSWGYADVHRLFPGLTAADAFDALWEDHRMMEIAGVPCPTPSLTAQRLILLLHVARNGRTEDADYQRAWEELDAEGRRELTGLADRLGARVGLAAALGHLDQYANDPSHDLWAVFSGGDHSRLAEWEARLKAAPSKRARLRLLVRALLVNTDHLALRLARRPSRGEIIREFFARIAQALREMRRAGR
ncbi:nucleotidyltransferase family protein [Actinomyces faecalis]|uniref:nucleotidyltransferase family protein n=1 Tax=Actinomyces faecalis TaxID=2722820 RepID=UPI0015576EB1|nr:nucleotidyltransferase family protein [Actinomyces faecalis]